MVLDNKLEVIDAIDLKIKPDNGRYSLAASAMKINGIDIIQHDTEAITETEASKKFYDFCFKHGSLSLNKMIPAGHNISLDIRFVKRHLLEEQINPEGNSWGRFFSYRRLDTATIAHFLRLAGKLPDDIEGSLGSLANHFGLSYEGAHNAKFDAELSLEILKLLIGLIDDAPSY